MSARPALIARCGLAALALALTSVIAGCAPPGTPVASKQASELDVATSRMSVACGYEEEITATGLADSRELTWIGSIAVSGATKLAYVYARDQSDIYQGESVGAIVNDSISLLAGCRLRTARLVLERALAHH